MPHLNSKIAELIGMHIGDGTLYKSNNSLIWELRGGLNEKEYYFIRGPNLYADWAFTE